MSSKPTLNVSPFSETKYEYTMENMEMPGTIQTCQIIIINIGKYALSKSGFNFYICQCTKHIIRTKNMHTDPGMPSRLEPHIFHKS